MHYNENADRGQRKKKDGTEQWTISFPRGRDGYVLKKVLVKPKFGKSKVSRMQEFLEIT